MTIKKFTNYDANNNDIHFKRLFKKEQQVVELSGYVIILVENVDGKIKLYGSPPDRDNLEVGDEILEVNGLTLDNISRTEAIRHIHDCIKSCTICLRVRKKNDTRLAWDIGNSVQDAFVIAVEEHARERLQRLAALNRVTPVDITQLSKKLQQSKSGAPSSQKQDLSFLNEASPIYVTSFTSNQITCSSSTVTTATAGLITSSTIAPTSGTITSTATVNTTTTKALISSTPSQAHADRNANTATASATASATAAIINASAAAAVVPAATAKLTNHSLYQQQQFPLNKLQQKPQIATSLQHLPVAEEDDDDDEDLIGGGANYCSINFINYNNKNAQITATAPIAAVTGIQTPAVVTTTVTVQHHQYRPPPLQIPNAVLVDAQTSTSPLSATVINNIEEDSASHIAKVLNTSTAKGVAVTSSSVTVTPRANDGTRTPKTEYSSAIQSSQIQQAFAGYQQKQNLQQLQQQQQYLNQQQQLLQQKQQQLYNNNNINNNFIATSSKPLTSSSFIHQPQQPFAQPQLQQQLQHPKQFQQQHKQQQHKLLHSSLSNNNNSNSILPPTTVLPPATTISSILTTQSASPLVNNSIGNSTIKDCGLVNKVLPGAIVATTKISTATPLPSTAVNTVLSSDQFSTSSNCDVLISNNIHPPRKELLSTLNEDSVSNKTATTNSILTNSQPQNQLQISNQTSSISIGRTELLLGDQSLRQDLRPRRRSGSSIVVIDGDDLKPCLPDDYISSQHYRQHTNDSKDIDQEMLTMLSANQDNGPHREMAVDCPDNFIARNKTPPRYPPPRPVQVNVLRHTITRTHYETTNILITTTTTLSSPIPNDQVPENLLNHHYKYLDYHPHNHQQSPPLTKKSSLSLKHDLVEKYHESNQALKQKKPNNHQNSNKSLTKAHKNKCNVSPTHSPAPLSLKSTFTNTFNRAHNNTLPKCTKIKKRNSLKLLQIKNYQKLNHKTFNNKQLIVAYHSPKHETQQQSKQLQQKSHLFSSSFEHEHDQPQQQHLHSKNLSTSCLSLNSTTILPLLSPSTMKSTTLNDWDLNETNFKLQQQNLLNQQQQLKLEKIENCLDIQMEKQNNQNSYNQQQLEQYQQQQQKQHQQHCHFHQQQSLKTTPSSQAQQQQQVHLQQKQSLINKFNTSLDSLKKQKYTTNDNPNGSGSSSSSSANNNHQQSPEELELMLDGLYRKDSSSHSSSTFEEDLSKKSSDSFESISYRQLKSSNKSNHLISSSTTSNGNSIETNPSNSPIKVGSEKTTENCTNGLALVQGSCGDSLNSTRSSNSSSQNDDIGGGQPPPEYELRELNPKTFLPTPIRHRELPVDVPDSFIEVVKTTPRYPPPPHLSSLSSQISNSSTSTANTLLTNNNSLGTLTTASITNMNNINNNNNNNMNNGNAINQTSSMNLLIPSANLSNHNNNIHINDNNKSNNNNNNNKNNNNSNRNGNNDNLNGYLNDCSLLLLEQQQQQNLLNHQQQPQPQQQSNSQSLKLLNNHKTSSSSTSSHGSLEILSKNSSTAILPTATLNGSVKPVPPPRDHLRIEKDGRLVNRTPAPQLPDRRIVGNSVMANTAALTAASIPQLQQSTQPKHIAQIIEPTPEQLDSIKKYQEQLRRRREEEELIAQQNEFLRNSLRGSRKLKALQDSKAMAQQQQAVAMQMERVTGVENEAYLEDEDAEKINGYGEMIAALTRLQNILTKSGLPTLAGRVSAAHNILSGAGVAHALAARHAVLQRRRPRVANPVSANSLNLQKSIVEVLAQSNSASAIELGNLLTSHEMEGLLLAHDRVATLTDPSPSPSLVGAGSPDISSVIPAPVTLPKSASVRGTAVAPPVVPTPVAQRSAMPLPQNIIQGQMPYMKPLPVPLPGMPLRPESPPLSACFGTLNDQNDNIRIIQIEKSVEPLGATVLNQGEAVVIGRIVRGGAAEKSGLLHEGDEILEVNGQELRGKTVHEVCALLSSMQGTLTFLIVPANSPPPGGGPRDNAILHVRAHFDYDPEDDLYIPCRELGISFQKGDVLHVISREDPKWWQAYREGEEDQTLAGLIPSQMYQHQREAIKLESLAASRDRDGKSNKSATLLCALKGKKKKRKKASSEAGYPLYATTAPDETEPEEILTYEEVALYYPRATHKRPIVLIGPPNIGRHELRQRLMADSDRFAAAVPHTSRARREGEVPGVDYHFISRQDFEADILARRFVEHGEYEKAYYGTSLEAIRTVVASGKICVLNLHPQSLKLLRASDLKPYVVLVAPPSLEKLRQKKIRNGEPFKDEELKDIIATARDMEARWGHLFDMIIINNDTERAYHQLLAEINSLEREPQWVPASWVYNNRDES